VSRLTSSLNLVLCDKTSTSVEMKHFSVGNMGWAAEIVDEWNAVVSPQAAESCSSVPQSSGNTSSLLQCAMFCKCISMLFFTVFCLMVCSGSKYGILNA